LDTKGVPGAGLAAVVAAEAAIVGAIAAVPYRTAPATPPASIDPAIATAAIDFLTLIISFLLRIVNRSRERRIEG
jgi:hypothetical protein